MAIEFHDIEIEDFVGTNVIRMKILGKLEKEDYDIFVPVIENMIAKHNKVRMLVELIEFKGWTLSAAWEDTKFGLRHIKDMEKIALVGDKKWEKGLEAFCKVFTTAEVRFFDINDLITAEKWILE